MAGTGTLLLDEIGDAPLSVQVKLLRVIEERRFSRVGEDRHRELKPRILAATNRNLEEAVANGTFRKDLLYRIRTIEIRIPPLRERQEDIAPLAMHFLHGEVAASTGRLCRISFEALDRLTKYPWPGNGRQLKAALLQAALLAETVDINVQDLPEEIIAA
jgi:DNA-binding NtrC family response regulator